MRWFEQRLDKIAKQPNALVVVDMNIGVELNTIDPDEASLMIETLQGNHESSNVTLVEDGVEAITYLRQKGQFADAVHPDLILLDLVMPRKNGHEVLAEIKSDPDLKRIPVIISITFPRNSRIPRFYGRSK